MQKLPDELQRWYKMDKLKKEKFRIEEELADKVQKYERNIQNVKENSKIRLSLKLLKLSKYCFFFPFRHN